jgi:hypothetical protein
MLTNYVRSIDAYNRIGTVIQRLNNILMCWQYYSAQLGLVNMYRVSDELFARRACPAESGGINLQEDELILKMDFP